MSAPNSNLVYKKLTEFEKACQYGTKNGFYFTNAMITKLDNDKLISKELINETVRHWIKRQPFLWATVKKDENNVSYFVSIEKEIDFTNIYYAESNQLNGWKDIMEEDLSKEFSDTEKLWTLKIVKHNESNSYAFLFSMLHSMFDSNVSYKYSLDFLNILGALIDNKECAEMKSSIHNITENVEDAFAKQNVRKDYKSSFNQPLIESNEFPEFFNGDYKSKSNGQNNIKFETLTIEREKADNLLKATKKFTKGAKLNSVFVLAICLAIKRIYSKHKIEDRKSIFYEIAINARKSLGLDDYQLACFVTCLFETINLNELNDESFWNLVEDRSKSLHSRLENIEEIIQLYNDVVKSLEVNDDNNYENQINFCISNLGVLKNTREGCPIKITNQYLVAKVPTNYGMYFSVATIDQVQHWVLVYYESLISHDMIKLFIEEFNIIIDEIISKV